MDIQIKSALIGAIIPTVGAFAIFFLGDFSTQSKLERDTVQVLSEKFDSVEKDMSYEDALQAVLKENENFKNENENFKAQLNELSKNIGDKQAEIDLQNSAEKTNKIIQSATEYGNDSDYVQALSILKTASKTPEIETLINDYTKKYEDQIITKANEFVNKEKYEEAINVINNALNVIPSDIVLKQTLEDIQNSKPQNLLNAIKPYESNGYSEKVGEHMQMGGKKYYNGFQLGTGFSTSFAIFNLDSKYTQITGIVGHVDESGDADKIVTIFADDILLKTIDINFQDLPKKFSIDVTGVNKLKIERTDGETQTGFGNLSIK